MRHFLFLHRIWRVGTALCWGGLVARTVRRSSECIGLSAVTDGLSGTSKQAANQPASQPAANREVLSHGLTSLPGG